MEGNFCDAAASFWARDHFSFLPEEINQLEVWWSPLSQQVLGVVREGERDNLVTGELRTSEQGQLDTQLLSRKNTFLVVRTNRKKCKISDKRSHHVEIIYTCINVYIQIYTFYVKRSFISLNLSLLNPFLNIFFLFWVSRSYTISRGLSPNSPNATNF